MITLEDCVAFCGLTEKEVAVQERAIQFAKENAEAGFAVANELTKANDLQDVLRLQSSFAQKQMQSYTRQAQDLGRLMTEATRRAKA